MLRLRFPQRRAKKPGVATPKRGASRKLMGFLGTSVGAGILIVYAAGGGV